MFTKLRSKKTMTIMDAIKTVKEDNNKLALIMTTDLREHTSNDQIKEVEYKISFLDALLEHFGF
jgi:hypothetical protein